MLRFIKISIVIIAAGLTLSALVLFCGIWWLTSQPPEQKALSPYVEMAIGQLLPDARVEAGMSALNFDRKTHYLVLKSQDIKIFDASGRPLAVLPQVTLEASFLGLLQGKFVPAGVEIFKPQIWVRHLVDGSWTFGNFKTQSDDFSAIHHASTDIKGPTFKEQPLTPDILPDVRQEKSDLASQSDNVAKAPQSDNVTKNEKPIKVQFGIQRFLEAVQQAEFLRHLVLNEADVSVINETDGKEWHLSIPQVSLNHGFLSMDGVAEILAGQDDKKTSIKLTYNYDGHKYYLGVDFSNFNPANMAGQIPALPEKARVFMAETDLPISGKLGLTVGKELELIHLIAQINAGAGVLNVPEFWEKPREVRSFSFSAGLDKEAGVVDITDGVLDFGTTKLTFAAHKAEEFLTSQPEKNMANQDGVSQNSESGKNFIFSVKVGLDQLAMDQFTEIWPKGVVPGAREWISQNLSKGKFSSGTVTVKAGLNWQNPLQSELMAVNGQIAAEDATVSYIPGLPAVENVSAVADFNLDEMAVKVASGTVGALKLMPSVIKLTDFQQKIQNISLPLQLTGPVPDIIRFIDTPPLNYASAIGLSAEGAKGTLTGTLSLAFPLLKAIHMSDIQIGAEAAIKGFASANLVPAIQISEADLDLKLSNNGFTIGGPALLNGVSAKVTYGGDFQQQEGKPQYLATVQAALGGAEWEKLGLKIFKNFVGTSDFSLQYEVLSKTLSTVSAEIDFANSGFALPDFGWNKKLSETAKLSILAELPKEKSILIKKLNLKGQSVNVSGSGVLDAQTLWPETADVNIQKLGRSTAKITVRKDKKNHSPYRISIEGNALDLGGEAKHEELKQPSLKTAVPAQTQNEAQAATSKSGPKVPLEILFNLENIYFGPNNNLTKVVGSAKRSQDGWKQFDINAFASANNPVMFKLMPLTPDAEGPRRLEITAQDFGKMLQGLALTDTIEGGKLKITGESTVERPKDITGKIRLSSFTVSGLPVLVQLVSAVSPLGFVDLLTGKASFSNLRGKFAWAGDVVGLSGVRTSGSLFGLNVDGEVNIESGEAALHGTVVPFSFFNSIINKIPLLGDMITGGEGQGVIAAAYSIKGKLSAPDISVNPVSLLAPGFLRDLFFTDENDGELSGPHNEAEDKDPHADQGQDKSNRQGVQPEGKNSGEPLNKSELPVQSKPSGPVPPADKNGVSGQAVGTEKLAKPDKAPEPDKPLSEEQLTVPAQKK